jgi:hypothetical protein
MGEEAQLIAFRELTEPLAVKEKAIRPHWPLRSHPAHRLARFAIGRDMIPKDLPTSHTA